MSLHRVW